MPWTCKSHSLAFYFYTCILLIPYTSVYKSHSCIRRTPKIGKTVLRNILNNTVLFDANPVITWSPRVSQQFFQDILPGTYCCIHNATCENRAPCVLPGQFWHQLIFPGAVSICFSIWKAYAWGSCVIYIKRWLSYLCLSYVLTLYMDLTSGNIRWYQLFAEKPPRRLDVFEIITEFV